MERLTLANKDNFKFVEDESIDFILTDPPFNISKKTNFHTYEKNRVHSYQFDGESSETWDTYSHEEFLKIMDSWASEWARVLKPKGNFAIFCADKYISHLWESLEKAGLRPRRVISWKKPDAVPVNRGSSPLSAIEYIIVGVKKGSATFNADIPASATEYDLKTVSSFVLADKVASIVYNNVRKELEKTSPVHLFQTQDLVEEITKKVIESLDGAKEEIRDKVGNYYKVGEDGEPFLQGCIPNFVQLNLKKGSRIHPTEKPVRLLEYLIALYSNKGDLILDSFGGSGSTGEAALSLDRKVILIEREKVFFERIEKRLKPLREPTIVS